MRAFHRLCIYCGSSNNVDARYFALAQQVGTHLAEAGIGVVYGGGSVGLMGALADAALAAGGEVIGVIPEKLRDLELGHSGVTKLVVVADMHQRKAAMAAYADGFIALPGGWGTLEEIFEVTTWTQLRYHDKPVGLFNKFGFYDGLITFLEHVANEGFIRPRHRHLIQVASELGTLLALLAQVQHPEVDASALQRRPSFAADERPSGDR